VPLAAASVSLALGGGVVALTLASQLPGTGVVVSGLIAGDIAVLALIGLVVSVVCSVLLARAEAGTRGRATAGVLMSLSPVAVLAYYLATTAG